VTWFYYLAKIILRTLFFLLTRHQVKGIENVPSQGPLLIVANHLSLADPPLIGVSVGRRISFMAKQELFHSKFFSHLIRNLGAFSVHRGRLDRNALRQVNQAFASGQALIMFPEGMRSLNGQLRPAFSGSALIALHNSVPILPVGITGTEKIKGVAWILRRPQITVNIGRPFYLPPVNSRLTKVKLAESTNYIMQHIAELLPPEYCGHYADEGNRKP